MMQSMLLHLSVFALLLLWDSLIFLLDGTYFLYAWCQLRKLFFTSLLFHQSRSIHLANLPRDFWSTVHTAVVRPYLLFFSLRCILASLIFCQSQVSTGLSPLLTFLAMSSCSHPRGLLLDVPRSSVSPNDINEKIGFLYLP